LFTAIILIICSAAAYIGPPPAKSNTSDYPQFFDGAWRMLNGQRPHVDFYSCYGVLLFAPAVIGLRLTHTARALGYANSVVALFIGLWSYRISSPRMNLSGAVLASVFLALLAIAPYSLGDPPWVPSYAMVYNRQAYALLGILLIEAYSITTEIGERARDDAAGGMSSGAITAMLLFLKPNYFFVGLAFIAVSLAFSRSQRLRLWSLLAGFSLVTLGVLGYLRFNVGAWIRDLIMTAGARSTGLALGRTTVSSNKIAIASSFFPFVGLIVCAVIVPLAFRAEKSVERPARGWRPLIFAVIVSLAGFGLLLTNAQHSGLPLNGLFAILLAAEISFGVLPSRVGWRHLFTGAFLVLTFMIAIPPLCSDVLGLSLAMRKRLQSSGAGLFHAQPLTGLTTSEMDFVDYVNDGLDLLRHSSTARETVTTFDCCSDPFSYALERPPFRGGSIAMVYHFSFSDRFKPSADWLLGGADLVMVPKSPVLPLQPLEEMYGAFLNSRFHLAAESARWFLYRRVPPP
jgi:hypothetical protein